MHQVRVPQWHAADPDATPWSIWKCEAESEGKIFFSSNCLGQLLIAFVSISLTVEALHIIERVASVRFERKQWWERMHGRVGLFRVQALCTSKLPDKLLEQAEQLLSDPSKYATFHLFIALGRPRH